MALDKFKNFFANGEEDENEEVEQATDKKHNIKDMVSNGNKMILLEPRAYSESQQIADHLKRKNSVVVNLKRVTPDQGKRIVDFLSGTVLCTPASVNVEGKISDEPDQDEEKGKKTSKKTAKDFDYEW